MSELLTAAQMRAIEAAAIASGEVTGLDLMERAGRGVVQAVWEEWPALKAGSHRAVVLCGPGNNGGDGFVVARLLKDWGWEVEVFLYGDPERMPPDARVNYARWVGMGEVKPLTEDAFREEHPIHGHAYAELYVDAIFGAGLSRSIEGDARDVLTQMSGRNGDDYVPYTVAIDAPSGLCLNSGRFLGSRYEKSLGQGGQAVARLTVTFGAPKIGHYLGLAPHACGKLATADIGIDPWLRLDNPTRFRGNWTGQRRRVRTSLAAMGSIDATFQLNKINPRGLAKAANWNLHKYSFGHAYILSGPSGQGGAARLAARGALRIGAGLVTVGCPPEAIPENAAQLNAIMLKPIGDAAALTEALQDKRITAVCLGPGMGVERAADLVSAALQQSRGEPRPTVLDADALTALSRDPTLFAQLHKNCILTPHAGEFARLFPDIAAKLNAPAATGPAYSKVDATCEAAKRAGCTILFKGPDTVIADPTGRCSINSAQYDRAAPWLATAGSGDVLAGFITGLLARGFQPLQAAETAAWLHVEAARSFGPGLIAEDLPEELPKVFRALGL